MSHMPRVQGGQVGPATYDQAYEVMVDLSCDVEIEHVRWWSTH